MSSVDQKRSFNKLKHDMESWRELILLVNSVLKWDKKFFPGIIFGAISFLFLILWYLDLSTLTLISLAILTGVVFDYVYPIASKFIFKAENWTGEHEAVFEAICNELCSARMKLCSGYQFLFKAKEQKSTVFLIGVSIALLACAWIGSIIDNLLLGYLAVLAVALYPGLHQHGFIGTVKTQVGGLISSKIQQLKEKTGKTE